MRRQARRGPLYREHTSDTERGDWFSVHQIRRRSAEQEATERTEFLSLFALLPTVEFSQVDSRTLHWRKPKRRRPCKAGLPPQSKSGGDFAVELGLFRGFVEGLRGVLAADGGDFVEITDTDEGLVFDGGVSVVFGGKLSFLRIRVVGQLAVFIATPSHGSFQVRGGLESLPHDEVEDQEVTKKIIDWAMDVHRD